MKAVVSRGGSFLRGLPVNQVKSANANGSAGPSFAGGVAASARPAVLHTMIRTASLAVDGATGHSSGGWSPWEGAIAVPVAGTCVATPAGLRLAIRGLRKCAESRTATCNLVGRTFRALRNAPAAAVGLPRLLWPDAPACPMQSRRAEVPMIEGASARPADADGDSRAATRVLIVDDERNIRRTLAVCLEGMGCRTTEAGSSVSALEAISRSSHDVAFVDLRLGQESGLDLLPKLLAERPGLDVVMITAYAKVDTAVEAIKRGAKDYLPKPFAPAQIKRVIDAFRARRDLERRIVDLEEQLADAAPQATLEASSAAMRAVMEVVSRAASHDVPVLLRGESGTGKSVLARVLHQMSARRDRPFAVVSCPALSEQLLASEMFGHARGAFTGAVTDRAGRVEAAEGGTLFLDEVGEIPPPMQSKLLRFLPAN